MSESKLQPSLSPVAEEEQQQQQAKLSKFLPRAAASPAEAPTTAATKLSASKGQTQTQQMQQSQQQLQPSGSKTKESERKYEEQESQQAGERKMQEKQEKQPTQPQQQQPQQHPSVDVHEASANSPLLLPQLRTAPLPGSPVLSALGIGSPSLKFLGTEQDLSMPGSPQQKASSPRVVLSNSRNQKRAAKVASSGLHSPLRQPGRTITGQLTPEAKAEEERIIEASKANKNVESIVQIMENEKKQILSWYDAYTNTRDVYEQSKKMSRFKSQLAQFLDKTRILLYGHLLTIVAPRVLPPRVTPSSKLKKLFREDPQVLLKHLLKRLQEINNKLFDFNQMTMHGPKYEDKLQEILKLLDEQESLHKEYLYPFMYKLYPTEESLIAYGQSWSDYLLRAKTAPQPPPVTEEISKLAYVSGVNPSVLARAFQQQPHL